MNKNESADIAAYQGVLHAVCLATGDLGSAELRQTLSQNAKVNPAQLAEKAKKIFKVSEKEHRAILHQVVNSPDPFAAAYYVEVEKIRVINFEASSCVDFSVHEVLCETSVVDNVVGSNKPTVQHTMPSRTGPSELHLGPSLASPIWNLNKSKLVLELRGRGKSKNQKIRLGKAEVSLSKLSVGSKVENVFDLKGADKNITGTEKIQLKAFLTLVAIDLHQLENTFRRQFQNVARVIMTNSITNNISALEADENANINQGLTSEEHVLLSLHATYAKVSEPCKVVDCFCAWVQADCPYPQLCCTAFFWLKRMSTMFQNQPSSFLFSNDIARLQTALSKFVSICIQAIGDPMNHFVEEHSHSQAKECLLALIEAGTISVWETPERQDPEGSDALTKRLHSLLQGEDATLSKVTATLAEEYGTKVVHDRKDEISQALIAEMQLRRWKKGRSVCGGQREVLKELEIALTRTSERRFEALRNVNEPTRNFAGSECIVLTKTIVTIREDLETLKLLDRDSYALPNDDWSVFWFCVKGYDSCIHRYLGDILRYLDDVSDPETDNVAALFDLYNETRMFVDTCIDHLSENFPCIKDELKSASYGTLFEPFVIRWITTSQNKAGAWVDNSLSADTWKPVTSEMYSTSMTDVCRAISEIVELYIRLDWPDEEKAAKVFTPAIVQTASDVANKYALKAKNIFLSQASPSECFQENGHLVQLIDKPLCCLLNNLDELEMRIDTMLSTIPAQNQTVTDLIRNERERCQNQIANSRKVIIGAVSSWLGGLVEAELCKIIQCVDIWSPKYLDVTDKKLGNLLNVPSDHSFLESGVLQGGSKGIYCANLMMMATNISEEETANSIVLTSWRYIVNFLRNCILGYAGSVPEHLRHGDHVPAQSLRPKASLRPGFQSRLGFVVSLMLEQMVSLLVDDGDGIPYKDLLGISIIVDPLLPCCEMPTKDLILHFFTKGASLQVEAIREAERRARKYGDVSIENPEPVEGCLGYLKLCLKYDHANDTISVSIQDVLGLSNKREESRYFKLRRCPPSDSYESSWRSDKKTKENVHAFMIPNVSESGVALQLRVQSRSRIKRQRKTVAGECLLCIPTITQTTRRLTLWAPVYPTKYSQSLGEVQQLITERSLVDDAETNYFIKIYPKSSKPV
eukprot:m.41142 g.41142  ORF g.41142 m.41142 type:complete len:1149 (+) comp9738_c1_seq2:221-3667(+)